MYWIWLREYATTQVSSPYHSCASAEDPEVRMPRGADFGVTAADVQVTGGNVPQVAIDDDDADGDISRGGQRV